MNKEKLKESDTDRSLMNNILKIKLKSKRNWENNSFITFEVFLSIKFYTTLNIASVTLS